MRQRTEQPLNSQPHPGLRQRLLLFLLLACIQIPAAQAFIFTVNTTVDSVDSNTADGICLDATNLCSLRAAIQQANAWPGSDTIILNGSTYLLTITGANEEAALSGDLDIRDDLTIEGNGSIIDASGLADRVFDMATGTTVNLNYLTIRAGSALNGGGLQNAGLLTLTDVSVSNNSASLNGGGIYQTNLNANIDMTRVTVSANSSAGSGGGIAIPQGGINLYFCQINNNLAAQNGGGLSINGGVIAIIEDTLINNNTADSTVFGQGGGISNFGALTIRRSTISNNSTRFRGAGIYVDGPATAPSATAANLTIINSTLQGNQILSSTGTGGGLYVSLARHSDGSDAVTLQHTTFTGNSTVSNLGVNIAVDPETIGPNQGFATLEDSIVVSQSAASSSCQDSAGHLTSGNYNIDNDNSCNLLAANDQAGVTTSVLNSTTPIANGGPTPSISPAGVALLPVNSGRCPATDQRGFPRTTASSGSCAIGAVEPLAAGNSYTDLAVISILDKPPQVLAGTALNYFITVKNNGPSATIGNVTLSNQLGTAAPTTHALGPLAVNASTTLNLTTTAALPGTFRENVISVIDDGGSIDPNHNNDQNIFIDSTIFENSDIQISTRITSNGSTVNPTDTIIAGSPFEITLTLNNSGGQASEVVLTDQLPAAIALLSATASVGSCSNNGGLISCQLGNLANGATATVTLSVNAITAGSLSNVARVNFLGSPTAQPAQASDTINIVTVTDLGLTVVAGSNTALIGTDLSYIASISNAGPSAATNPRLLIDLPTQVDLRSTISADAWSCDTSALPQISCTLPSLAAGDHSSLTLFTTPRTAGTATLAATISASAADSDNNLSNNNISPLLISIITAPTVIRGADLKLEILNALPSPATVGEKLSYSLTVVNLGPDTASNVLLTDALPSTVLFDSASAGCSLNGQAVECQLGQLASGTSASATITVIAQQAGTIQNSVVVTDTGGQDPVITNNTGSLDTLIKAATVTSGSNTNGLRKGSGACFIATAAYGSYLDAHVQVLRDFRDQQLLTNAPGRWLVDFYYRHSPTLANIISRHEGLRMIVRWSLTPFIWGLEYPLRLLAFCLLLLAWQQRHVLIRRVPA